MYLHEVCGFGEQLCVNGKPAIERIPRRSYKSHCKFSLEHENSTSKEEGRGIICSLGIHSVQIAIPKSRTMRK